MRVSLQRLLIERAMKLGEEAYRTHQELLRWREKPLDKNEEAELKTKVSIAFQDQAEWLRELYSGLNDED
jgi:hypothetical protein